MPAGSSGNSLCSEWRASAKSCAGAGSAMGHLARGWRVTPQVVQRALLTRCVTMPWMENSRVSSMTMGGVSGLSPRRMMSAVS